MGLWEKLKSIFRKEKLIQIEAPIKEIINMIQTGNIIELSSSPDREETMDSKTELYIDLANTKIVENTKLYCCRVEYKNGEEIEGTDSAGIEEILIDIDMEKLENDSKYRSKLMNSLLEENRIKALLENGMDQKPKRPSGNYVGSVIKKENGTYTRAFDTQVGRAVHNGSEYEAKRAA